MRSPPLPLHFHHYFFIVLLLLLFRSVLALSVSVRYHLSLQRSYICFFDNRIPDSGNVFLGGEGRWFDGDDDDDDEICIIFTFGIARRLGYFVFVISFSPFLWIVNTTLSFRRILRMAFEDHFFFYINFYLRESMHSINKSFVLIKKCWSAIANMQKLQNQKTILLVRNLLN